MVARVRQGLDDVPRAPVVRGHFDVSVEGGHHENVEVRDCGVGVGDQPYRAAHGGADEDLGAVSSPGAVSGASVRISVRTKPLITMVTVDWSARER